MIIIFAVGLVIFGILLGVHIRSGGEPGEYDVTVLQNNGHVQVVYNEVIDGQRYFLWKYRGGTRVHFWAVPGSGDKVYPAQIPVPTVMGEFTLKYTGAVFPEWIRI